MSTKRKAAAASQQTLKSEEFVASDSDEGTVDNGRASRSKEKQEEAVDSEQEAEEEKPKQKKQKKTEADSGTSATAGWQKDPDGRPYKKLSDKSMKRVTISTFKGKTFVDIREYYTDKASGQEKPGKKGISLQMDDWNTLKGLTEEIDQQLK